ncbi:NAD(P)/FAD-dependent oxidoreductase [Nocardia sp. NEAU-G5]|uniref:NAD(P)/FAD-dependent oxidoreductase n=1 Tax=Nocardia albiluteola TaxID=2842303 RepID=A0ABS6B0V8_9NOCA|nr:NAD(P)/FAD-dependent oxidoreductase [Nocardia albiluteola]MBU3063927.1 NAD(P)/FAD-dependent oxidoreductase [Nocardia albiluteola]
MVTEQVRDAYDVIVVGGGAAGLNGALMLSRSRRSVAVIDSGAPRNAPADGVHGLLARDGTPPGELLERGRAEVAGYGGTIVRGEVVDAARDGAGFAVTLADGRSMRARRLLVTTGVVDELPDIPGLREQWGRGVVHCPYCHGWEVRDQAIGVLGTGPMSMHQAQLFRQLSDDVVYFTHVAGRPGAQQAAQLSARGIRVVEGAVVALEISGDRITGVRLADGTVVPRAAVAVHSRIVARTGFLRGLGLTPVEHPSGAGDYLPADPMGRSEIPGVWLAGNVSNPMAQVGNAAAEGAMAGAQINMSLIEEEIDTALAVHGQAFSAADEAEVGELVGGDRRHGV